MGKKVVGTTLKVYLHLLKVKRASARQVYNDLEMSSPWLAEYHLNKLSHLRLASKDIGGVYHADPERFGMLRFFVVTRKWIVPRTLFYTILFASAAAYFFFSVPENWRLIIVVLMLIPTLINAFETVLFYKTLSRTAG